MNKLSWKAKLYLFAIITATIPVIVTGFLMTGITEDELRQKVNSELLNTSKDLETKINNLFAKDWTEPLKIVNSSVKYGLGNTELKAIIQSIAQNNSSFIQLKLFIETQKGVLSEAINTYNLDFLENSRNDEFAIRDFIEIQDYEINELISNNLSISEPVKFESNDIWSILYFIKEDISELIGTDGNLYTSARINISELKELIINHPFNKIGSIKLLNKLGQPIFRTGDNDLVSNSIYSDAISNLNAGNRFSGINSLQDSTGNKIIVSYAYPKNMEWVIITEINESEAYKAVSKMEETFYIIIFFVVGLTVLVVSIVSGQISKPIVVLSEKANQISKGDFEVKVDYKANDEIGVLGKSLENMAYSLKESFTKIEYQNRQLEEYNRTLEQKVDQRTKELKEKNDQLEDTLKKLRETQNQLVAQEKLASLGALTAGIAHEIQNPLNFVNNFSRLTKELVSEIEDEMDNIKSSIKEDDSKVIFEIMDDISLNVSKIEEHGKRAESIVRSMLEHSRGDKGEFKKTNLNNMLEEAINLGYHGLRSKDHDFNVKIERRFDSSIDEVHVNPQALNRVFLNIINNALYELSKKQKIENEFSPVLTVFTKNNIETVEIRIKDNGRGITPEHLKRIFEPFFTTKPTGEGTGLGLSLSYDIIKTMHHGEITVESEAGVFTEFIIIIPNKN